MKNAFENCNSLNNINNIKNVRTMCFSGCSNLLTINLLEGSTIIGFKSFENCYRLESISIPSSVRTISEYAFFNCTNLKSINFSQTNSLMNISINSFSGCKSLKNISNFESYKYKCIDNTLYYKNDTSEYLIYHTINASEKVLILNCSVICRYSFNECNNIYNITIIPNTVSLIQKYSFNKCLNLQHVNFPYSVEIVESNSFVECHSIRCPLIIENTKLDFIRMIINSGIPRQLILSCGVYHDSNKLQSVKRICNTSTKLFFGQLSK